MNIGIKIKVLSIFQNPVSFEKLLYSSILFQATTAVFRFQETEPGRRLQSC